MSMAKNTKTKIGRNIPVSKKITGNECQNLTEKYFPKKVDFYDDKMDIMWKNQIQRITSENKIINNTTNKSSASLQKTFYKVI